MLLLCSPDSKVVVVLAVGKSRLRLSIVVALLALVFTVVPVSSAAPGDLTSHRGPVVRVASVFVIFWLPAGRRFDTRLSDAGFESFVRGGLAALGPSAWWRTLSQYQVGSLAVGGSWVDTTAYPHAGTRADPLQTSDYRAAVRRALAANHWRVGMNRIYLVITARHTEACGLDKLIGNGITNASPQRCTFPTSDRNFPTSDRNACVGHSFFFSTGQPVVYAVLPESSDRACIPGPGQSPNHDLRADQVATLDSALLAETAIDPLGNGWYIRRTDVGLLCNIPNPFPLHLSLGVYALFGLHSNAQHRCVHGYPPLKLVVSLSSPMVKVGERETLTVSTAPGAAITFTPSDGGDRGFETKANARGHFTFSWIARPQPLRGSDTVEATLNGRSAQAIVFFQIVK